MKLIVIDKPNSGVTLTLKIGQGHSSSNSTCKFLRCISVYQMKTTWNDSRDIAHQMNFSPDMLTAVTSILTQGQSGSME